MAPRGPRHNWLAQVVTGALTLLVAAWLLHEAMLLVLNVLPDLLIVAGVGAVCTAMFMIWRARSRGW